MVKEEVMIKILLPWIACIIHTHKELLEKTSRCKSRRATIGIMDHANCIVKEKMNIPKFPKSMN